MAANFMVKCEWAGNQVDTVTVPPDLPPVCADSAPERPLSHIVWTLDPGRNDQVHTALGHTCLFLATERTPMDIQLQKETTIKLQKLKRSLSFKTKSLRSKSADNFFQRTNSEDTKLQAHMVAEVSPGSSPLPAPGSLTSTPARAGLHPGGKTHAFQEHIFKKPTFCDVCNHMIVGTNAKHGLRCKACKMSIHHKCADGLSPQRCMGKLPKGFRRYYSSPLLIHEQFGCIKEVMPIACGNKVDPVYETLRFGTSLAQRTKKGSSGSGSDSPHRTSTSDLVEVPEEADGPGGGYDLRKRSNSVFTYPENGTDDFRDPAKNINHQVFTDVTEDKPGDIITLLEDSNEDWWKGKIQDRIGFFPANFVQRVQQNEKIFRCVRTFIGCKEQGQITLKENQICMSSEEEQDGFIRVLSGKKKGLVPLDVLENI
nr:SH3 and cysteine-rich domain-containing protein [Aotus nancymaae]